MMRAARFDSSQHGLGPRLGPLQPVVSCPFEKLGEKGWDAEDGDWTQTRVGNAPEPVRLGSFNSQEKVCLYSEI